MRIIAFIIITILPATNSIGQILTTYNNKNKIEMKHLNIEKIKEVIKLLNEDQSQQNLTKVISAEPNLKITAYIDSSSRFLHYSEKDEKKIVSVTGNEIQGFLTTEKEFSSLIEENAEFYGDGTLKRLTYFEYAKNRINKKRPFGIWYYYDQNGILIEKTEYDYEVFKFSRDDVREFVVKNYQIEDHIEYVMNNLIKSARVKVNGQVTQEAEWIVSIPESGTPRRDRVLHIDATTGGITREHIMEFNK